jgi:hypothetical protein
VVDQAIADRDPAPRRVHVALKLGGELALSRGVDARVPAQEQMDAEGEGEADHVSLVVAVRGLGGFLPIAARYLAHRQIKSPSALLYGPRLRWSRSVGCMNQ